MKKKKQRVYSLQRLCGKKVLQLIHKNSSFLKIIQKSDRKKIEVHDQHFWCGDITRLAQLPIGLQIKLWLIDQRYKKRNFFDNLDIDLLFKYHKINKKYRSRVNFVGSCEYQSMKELLFYKKENNVLKHPMLCFLL